MPSSYTSSLRLTLPATGELSGTWGTTVNTGITELTDAAIAGYASVAMTDADYTLTVANGATDQARRMMLNMTGTLTAARNVICPTASKLYVIKNATTGGFAITLKTSAGTGISVPNGDSVLLMCNGTDVVQAITQPASVTYTNLAYTGTLTGGTGVVNLGSGQFYKDASGNVGIGGVAEAGIQLKVFGAVKIQSAQPTYLMNSDNTNNVQLVNAGATGASNGQMAFTLGGVGEAMRLTSTGLGIGTSSPGARLDVLGLASSIGLKVRGGGNSGINILDIADAGGSGPLVFNASGNLGIGTSSPTAKLSVAGGVNITSDTVITGGSLQIRGGIPFYAWNSDTTNYYQINNSGATGAGNAQLVFGNAGGEKMRLDSSGNLGIGTSSPDTKLTVAVADAATSTRFKAATGLVRFRPYVDATSGAVIDVTNSAESAYLPLTLTGSTLRLFGNNGTGAVVDSSGNLGLGVTPSANAYGSTKTFFISGDSAAGLLALSEESISATSQYVSLMNNAYPDGPGIYKYKKTSQVATNYRQSDGAHAWFTAPSGTAGNAITFTQAMTLDASGNLGVGNTSPAAKLDVAGNARISSGSSFYWGDATAQITATSGGAMQFLVGDASERARITSGGEFVLKTGSLQEVKTALAANNIDIATGNYFTKTISGATTLTVSNVPASGTAASFIFDLTNGGSAAITWWTGVKWAGGTAPTLTAAGRDVLGFFTYDGGTTWTGLLLGKDVK